MINIVLRDGLSEKDVARAMMRRLENLKEDLDCHDGI